MTEIRAINVFKSAVKQDVFLARRNDIDSINQS